MIWQRVTVWVLDFTQPSLWVMTSDKISFRAAWRLTSHNHKSNKIECKMTQAKAKVSQPLRTVKGWTAVSSLKWKHFKIRCKKNAVASVSSKVEAFKKALPLSWQRAQRPVCLSSFSLGTSASSHRPNASTEGTREPSCECWDRLQLLSDADLYGTRYTIVNIKVCVLLIVSVKKKTKKSEWATQQKQPAPSRYNVSEDEIASLFSHQVWWIVSFRSGGVWHSIQLLAAETHETLRNRDVQSVQMGSQRVHILPLTDTLQLPIAPDGALTCFNVLTACSTDLINHAPPRSIKTEN